MYQTVPMEDVLALTCASAIKDGKAKVVELVNAILVFTMMVITAIDINECENTTCHHLCNNTEGSYNCYCNDGYNLLNDNTTCEGMQTTNSNYMYMY